MSINVKYKNCTDKEKSSYKLEPTTWGMMGFDFSFILN